MTEETTFDTIVSEILSREGILAPLEETEPGPDHPTIGRKETTETRPGEIAHSGDDGKDNEVICLSILDGIKAGKPCVIAGVSDLEYRGKLVKAYRGYVIAIVKPNRGVIVHQERGVMPYCYMVKPRNVAVSVEEGQLRLSAEDEGETLVIRFAGPHTAFELPAPDARAVQERGGREPAAPSSGEKKLEAALKALRVDLAREHHISYLPAIFDNRMLGALIKERPGTKEALKQIRGFGPTRLEKYGDRILQTLNTGSTGDSVAIGNGVDSA